MTTKMNLHGTWKFEVGEGAKNGSTLERLVAEMRAEAFDAGVRKGMVEGLRMAHAICAKWISHRESAGLPSLAKAFADEIHLTIERMEREEEAKTDTLTARCSICGLQVHDWVDPDWAHGRICRSCESRHEPREEKAE